MPFSISAGKEEQGKEGWGRRRVYCASDMAQLKEITGHAALTFKMSMRSLSMPLSTAVGTSGDAHLGLAQNSGLASVAWCRDRAYVLGSSIFALWEELEERRPSSGESPRAEPEREPRRERTRLERGEPFA